MPLSFSMKFSYSLSTHYVVFDHTNLYVKLKSDDSTVKTISLGGGVDIRVNSGNFQTGTISGINGSFNRTIDFNVTASAISFDAILNKIIGDSDTTDQGATKHTYLIGQSNTPINIIKNGSQIVTFMCPCDLSDCSTLNSGYTQIN